MLKKIFTLTLLVVGCWCCSAFAAGERVVFYPNGADFTGKETVSIEKDENGEFVVFTLSGQAVPETFTIAALTDGVAVNDVSWSRSDLSRSPAALDLGKKIDQLKLKLATLMSEKQAVEGGIAFWLERGKAQDTKTADLDKISGMVVGNLARLYEKNVGLDVKIKETADLVAELERKLGEISGSDKAVWEVRVSVDAGGADKAGFRIGYMLRNCGWTPKYKLDAFPDAKAVKFTFEAEINQGSGMDFKGCDIALATVKKQSRIAPPELERWVIEPEPEYHPEPMAKMMMDESVYMEAAVAPRNVSATGAARRVSKATYSLWELGRKSIPAGVTRKYAVESESWKADFTFLARPSLTPDIFVSAKSVLGTARDYPAGPALVFMEGTMIGKQSFIFSGKEKEMFFGSDPMLKAERKILEKQSGEKGLFGSKQTFNWKYLIELKNSRSKPVEVLVQEAAPISGDKRIKLEIAAKPQAEIKDDNFEWQIEVPAGGEASVEYGVGMKAPDDMRLDLGIGR
ncbi:DUF4139 domain-containing protein [Maridesulfovibrio sp. FT414]|uniref:DUF4139 domain-containing protein n=1 Tax=Maridesulfovibrio sp. FT414 TaxID=2979469 RepID=UPI003D803A55